MIIIPDERIAPTPEATDTVLGFRAVFEDRESPSGVVVADPGCSGIFQPVRPDTAGLPIVHRLLTRHVRRNVVREGYPAAMLRPGYIQAIPKRLAQLSPGAGTGETVRFGRFEPSA